MAEKRTGSFSCKKLILILFTILIISLSIYLIIYYKKFFGNIQGITELNFGKPLAKHFWSGIKSFGFYEGLFLIILFFYPKLLNYCGINLKWIISFKKYRWPMFILATIFNIIIFGWIISTSFGIGTTPFPSPIMFLTYGESYGLVGCTPYNSLPLADYKIVCNTTFFFDEIEGNIKLISVDNDSKKSTIFIGSDSSDSFYFTPKKGNFILEFDISGKNSSNQRIDLSKVLQYKFLDEVEFEGSKRKEFLIYLIALFGVAFISVTSFLRSIKETIDKD